MKSLKLELFVVFVSPISVSDPKPLKFDLKIQLFSILTQSKIALIICLLQCPLGQLMKNNSFKKMLSLMYRPYYYMELNPNE